MSRSLREKATVGVAWGALERISQFGLVFVVQVILARILEPDEFGLLGMVSVFVVLSGVVVESGLGAAIVQRSDITDTDLSTVFIFNTAVAVLMACALWLGAPWIASFYSQPVLEDVVAALGLGLVFSALGTVHRAMLQKQLAFKMLFWVTTPSTLVSGLLGIAMAAQGFGVWALVGQTLCQRALNSVCLWGQTKWMPRAVFDMARFGKLFSYGARLAVSGILYQGFNNIYLLVIGRAFSPVEVGLFQRAKAMQELPITTLQSVVGNVTFPVLAAVQKDRRRMTNILRRSLQLSSLIAFPGMAVLAGLAEPIILILVGAKWLPCVPMLQLLCVSGAFYPIQAGNLSLLQATGRSDMFLRLEVIKKLTTIINIAITYRFGIYAMICGMIATSLLALVINTHYTAKIIHYNLVAQMRDLLPAIGLGVLVFAVTSGVSFISSVGAGIKVVLGFAVAGSVALLALRLMPSNIKEELRIWNSRLPEQFNGIFDKLLST